jgi:hypothetical protein
MKLSSTGILAALAVVLSAGAVRAGEAGFVEDFSLATDRDAALKQLIPGTEDYYARMKDGSTNFYKDGYTDLRGRFDYTSLSTSELDSVERFSILVLSDANGATVKEAAPPKQ